jgi:hypothetical protein
MGISVSESFEFGIYLGLGAWDFGFAGVPVDFTRLK